MFYLYSNILLSVLFIFQFIKIMVSLYICLDILIIIVLFFVYL